MASWLTSLLLLLAAPSWAVTNALTITERSGSTQTNVPITVARPFASGEVATCPQAIVDGTPITTQADVKQRWTSDSSVRHAILSFVLPSLTASSTVTVTFQNQACSNTALTTAQMLDASYDFNARIELTNGTTEVADARTMLTAEAYSPWLSGSVQTCVILADHSLTRAYDIGFDSYKAFRPIIHACFWPATHQVRVRFIGEIANTEAQEDQTYDLALKTGNASPATVYTKAGFLHIANSRWTKEFWIGGTPGAIAINHNLAYLRSTNVVPYYDTTRVMSESTIASYYTSWTSASKDLGDAGNLQKGMGTTGGRPEIAPWAGWAVWWLYTGDARMREQAFGNADLSARWPIHYREGTAGKKLDRAGAVDGVGKMLSISTRPTTCWSCPGQYTYSYTVVADRVTPVGTIESSTVHGWKPDIQHLHDIYSPLYLLSGDYWYLEEAMFWAGWATTSTNGANYDYYGRGPTGAYGGVNVPVRAQAWVIRSRTEAYNAIPDAMPEKAYFQQLNEDAFAEWEGMRGITGTSLEGTTAYTWGTSVGGAYWSICNSLALGVPPQHYWYIGLPAFVQSPMDATTTQCAVAPWEQNFLIYALGRSAQVGLPATALLAWVGPNLISQWADMPSHYYLGAYRWGSVTVGDELFTWATQPTAFLSSYNPQTDQHAVDVANIGGDTRTGYALAAASQVSGGAALVNWLVANFLLLNPGVNNDPKFAILPVGYQFPENVRVQGVRIEGVTF